MNVCIKFQPTYSFSPDQSGGHPYIYSISIPKNSTAMFISRNKVSTPHITQHRLQCEQLLLKSTFFWRNCHTENWIKQFKYSWYECTLRWCSHKISSTTTYQFMPIYWQLSVWLSVSLLIFISYSTLYRDVLEWKTPGSCSISESDRNNDNR